MSTKRCFEKKRNFAFNLNQGFVTENLRQYNLYVIIRKKTLFVIRSKFSFQINEKQSFRQSRFKICDSLHL